MYMEPVNLFGWRKGGGKFLYMDQKQRLEFDSHHVDYVALGKCEPLLGVCNFVRV